MVLLCSLGLKQQHIFTGRCRGRVPSSSALQRSSLPCSLSNTCQCTDLCRPRPQTHTLPLSSCRSWLTLYFPDHRACYGVLRFIMESGAKGCEVIVSGKLRAQRAKAMKFKDGYMVSSGNPTRDYIDGAIRHVLLRQGVLGIKVGFTVPGLQKSSPQDLQGVSEGLVLASLRRFLGEPAGLAV